MKTIVDCRLRIAELKKKIKLQRLGFKSEIRDPRSEMRTGFTFIEIMVVVVIIGLLIAIVSPNLMNRVEEARKIQTKTQIRNLEQALKLFKLDNGFYPSSEQGLQALVEKPSVGRIPATYPEGGYLEKGKIPLDAWGNPFIYLSPGLFGEFDIISMGRDGKEGGESFDADIYSWDIE
jgi:general secretion pathway protein G